MVFCAQRWYRGRPFLHRFRTLSMKHSLVLCAALLACAVGHAQPAPAAPAAGNDTWGNVPSASDDRFTNPKSKLYAGPNGWHNFGEVRAEVAGGAGKRYLGFTLKRMSIKTFVRAKYSLIFTFIPYLLETSFAL